MTKVVNPSCFQCSSRMCSVFNELSSLELESMEGSKICKRFKKGEIIFMEGAYPHGLYCINKGKVKISQTGVAGWEQIVHLAKESDVMGYRAILSGDKYSCTATALEESYICYIPTGVFKTFLEKDHKFTLKLIKLISNELKMAERRITNIAQTTAKERLAQSLLLLKEFYGLDKDNKTLNVKVSRMELANIVGTARETVTRLLFEFEKEGSISLDGKKIKILDHSKLVKISNTFD